jgi:hypothetical protein
MPVALRRARRRSPWQRGALRSTAEEIARRQPSEFFLALLHDDDARPSHDQRTQRFSLVFADQPRVKIATSGPRSRQVT